MSQVLNRAWRACYTTGGWPEEPPSAPNRFQFQFQLIKKNIMQLTYLRPGHDCCALQASFSNTGRRLLLLLTTGALALTLAACTTVPKQSTWLKPESTQTLPVARVQVVYVQLPLTWSRSSTGPSYVIPMVRRPGGFEGLVRAAAPAAITAAGLQGEVRVVEGMPGVSTLLSSLSAEDRAGYALLLYFVDGQMGNYGGQWAKMELEAKLVRADNGQAVWKGGNSLMARLTPFGGRYIDEEMVRDMVSGHLKTIVESSKR